MRPSLLLFAIKLAAAILIVGSTTPNVAASKQNDAGRKGFRANVAEFVSKLNIFSKDLPKEGCGSWTGKGSAPWTALITAAFMPQNWFVIGNLLRRNFILTSSANIEVRYKDSYEVAFTYLPLTSRDWKVKNILPRGEGQSSNDVTLIELDGNIDLISLCLAPKGFKYTDAQQEYIPVFDFAHTVPRNGGQQTSMATKFIRQSVETMATDNRFDYDVRGIRKVTLPEDHLIGNGAAILQKDEEGNYVMVAIADGVYLTTHVFDAICITKDIRKWIVKTILKS